MPHKSTQALSSEATLKYLPSKTKTGEKWEQYLKVNWLLLGRFLSSDSQILQADMRERSYFLERLRKERPSMWSERINFELGRLVFIEKYLWQDLQRYKREDSLLVFLITDEVDKHLGHLYFFSHTPLKHRLSHHINTNWLFQVTVLIRYRLDTKRP